ncbi:hypothetical protein BTW15_09045 [Pseudomonas syringae pv. tomato]|uniref:Uncharacterized protein n=1 Tax=Pseudomonas syringae pv. tomato TaxID=323 RepID=A0AB36KVB3_PSEUB|nr:hypothetical protein XJ28_07910 [Pseudomonas syringae pv. tomato]QBI64633.1 hypothetical protein EIZ61_25910 [Pseudomonas syringae]OPE60551.1 hypothetical protein BTW15_09045 [Pseudomonas syringae pv. tomato]TES61552.1 hypothetical protein E2N91_01915 [Pseudomonas syringae pv. tomato]TES62892.1 hypothetical protein E2N90_28690 [Pseudomonas syringae pv. tomato]
MFTCSPQFTKLVNRPLTKSRESAAPYAPNTPRVPPSLGAHQNRSFDPKHRDHGPGCGWP